MLLGKQAVQGVILVSGVLTDLVAASIQSLDR
jgi:hypothetical protein